MVQLRYSGQDAEGDKVMATTETKKSGTNAGTVIILVFLGMIMLVLLMALLNALFPGVLRDIFKPDQSLVKENQQLQSQLNETQVALGDTKAALAAERQKNVSATAGIVLIILVVILLLLYLVFWKNKGTSLTLDQAIAREIPRARRFFAFNIEHWPSYPKVIGRTVERVKNKPGAEGENEFLYYIEMEFIGKKSQYHQGIEGGAERVVTVAVASRSYLYREAWYPWLRINQAIEQSHKHDMWGYSAQKTKQDEDILDALGTAKSLKEAKEAYADDGVESTA